MNKTTSLCSLRAEYETLGINEYYITKGDTYENPHANDVANCVLSLWDSEWKTALDFASGNGLVTKIITPMVTHVTGCDKFLHERYKRETGKNCLPFSFEEIANFQVTIPSCDVIICSYAMDLVPKSYVNTLLYALSKISSNLIIIRPNNSKHEHISWKIDKEYRCGKARGVLYKSVDLFHNV